MKDIKKTNETPSSLPVAEGSYFADTSPSNANVATARATVAGLRRRPTRRVSVHRKVSAALLDPHIEKARELRLYEDFKFLSDLSKKRISRDQRKKIFATAAEIERTRGISESLKFLIDSLYEYNNELLPVVDPTLLQQWSVEAKPHRATFEHIERMWCFLARKTPRHTKSSLIPLPHAFFIPGERFQEGYYWDTLFALPYLLRTGREEIVLGQIENFFFQIENYGLVLNGNRDYYLTRSQPPVLSQMVRLYLDHEIKKGPLSYEMLQWIKERAYPLIKNDYEKFWMNPETRFVPGVQLNRHFEVNQSRPERYSLDNENVIGLTLADVRAEAESGKDFTDAFDGRATQYVGVLLNSTLYQVEQDLEWMARLLGDQAEVERFSMASAQRQNVMNEKMWDDEIGAFYDYNFVSNTRSSVLTADIFVSLHVGLANREQAGRMVALLPQLERRGGLMASTKFSSKQWDAPYGWAPHHYFAISGLKKYGFHQVAKRLAKKWIRSIDDIFAETGGVFEKIDAVKGRLPVEDGKKYPTQQGFLWTNGVYAWALTEILGHEPFKVSNS